MKNSYFVTNKKSPLWFTMWHALAVSLCGGPVTQPLTEKQISILVKNWGYEGTNERGHCFTLRDHTGHKTLLFIEA